MSSALRLEERSWAGGRPSRGRDAAAEEERMRGAFDPCSADGWTTLCERTPFAGDPLRDLLGCPGLWRGLRRGPHCMRVFDVPSTVDLEGEGGDEEERRSAARLLVDWAGATADGTPGGWRAPRAEDLDEWIEPARRYVRAGGHVAPLELTTGPGRLALRVPALVRIPEALGAARRAWLDEACHDAQQKWYMVRFGIDEPRACVRAEVDLSGAPPPLLPSLVELGFSALTCAAGWALPGLAVIADPGVASRTLDRRPRRARARRGNHEKDEKEERA